MTARIYMTHHVREPQPSGPVMAVAIDDAEVRYCDGVVILDAAGREVARVVYRSGGLPRLVKSEHQVRAWVETRLHVVPVMREARPREAKRRASDWESHMATKKHGGKGKGSKK